MEAAEECRPDRIFSLTLVNATEFPHVGIKVYKIRLWILFLFSFSTMLCGMLFPAYVSTANVTICFYEVTLEAVNWTTLIYMVVYIVLVFPVSSIMNYIDLRWTIIAAMVCNTAGCASQFFALKPGTFNNVMVSMFFGSLSNVLILSVPPALAARWFPSDEVSRACAFGVFGNQLGVALGFVLTPLVVSSDCTNKDLIGIGKFKVACILTGFNAFFLLLVILTFKNAPKVPPSFAEIFKNKEAPESHLQVILRMFKNIHFVLVFLLNGLIVGTYFALATILNDLILKFFPNREVEIGWMGMLCIVTGLVGSLIAGYILDNTHRFKEISLGICIATLLSSILFSCLLFVDKIWVQFVTISIFGFFLTSYLPIGFEFGVEVTYPLSENVSASLLNASAMIFGIIITYVTSYLLNTQGPIYSNGFLVILYLLCCIIGSFITTDYKRSKKCGDEKFRSEVNKGSRLYSNGPHISQSDVLY